MSGGGKGGGGGAAHDYYGTIAGLVCAGPVDELVAIIADGKTVWPDAPAGDWESGEAYVAGDLVRSAGRVWSCTVGHTAAGGNAPGVGGQWVEYTLKRSAVGVTNPQLVSVVGYGVAVFYWGTSDQVLSGVVPQFAAVHPPYRRQCFVILKDWLFGRERTSAPNVEFVVRRAPVQTIVEGMPAALDADGQANPFAFLAEAFTDPVFGLGQTSGLLDAPTWQTSAESLTADAAKSHLSPVLRDRHDGRAVASEVLAYFDGWLRWNSAGLIEAGRFLRSQSPPVIPDSRTLTVHDLVEEASWDSDGWPEVSSEVTVKFSDRRRAFKAGAVRWVNLHAQAVAGQDRETSLDRPWITRDQQAAVVAAESAKVLGEPALSGSLVVRLEKCEAIQPGDLFRLNLDAIGFSAVCRCEAKTTEAPPAGRATLRFSVERGMSEAPVAVAPATAGESDRPEPETVSLFQFVQAPPLLAGGADSRLFVLAARTSPVSIGLRLWLKEDDSALFYALGAQESWAVTGTLAQAYADTLPAFGVEPQDDTTETLRVTLDPLTAPADLAKIGETQTADAINDGALLVWIFRASNPKQFEVCTLREIRVVGAETFYRLKVRRARFGSARHSFSAGDRVFILHRASLAPYSHSRFASYAQAGTTATFRLQAYNAWREADLSDAAACPDRSYQFADLFAPSVSWSAIQYRASSGAAWSDVTAFGTDYDPAGQWRIVANLADVNGDLSSASLHATSGILSQTVATYAVSGASQDVETVFSLGEGDWTLILRVTDATGRQVEQQLVPVGGGSPVVIRSRAAGSTLVANPVASPRGGYVVTGPTVTLTCSTAGATIEYQVVSLGAAPGGSWTTYSAPVAVLTGQTLYARATYSGWTTSAVVRNDYRFRDPDSGR